MILKKASVALSSPTKATFSFGWIENETLLISFCPSTTFVRPSTFKTIFPTSLPGLKPINGYLLRDGLISTISKLSNNFFLEVACLAFEALALNLAINSSNSFFFASAFLFWSFACWICIWLYSYQKS